MYSIQKQPKILSARKSIDQTTSLGLGISVLQFGLDLYKFSQISFDDDESLLLDDNSKSHEKEAEYALINCGASTKDGALQKDALPCSKPHTSIPPQELGRCFIIGVMLSAQLFLVIVDTFLYRFLLPATQKENIGDCWLGLYLQLSLLTYNVAEILIVAHNGIFDGSSILLAARAIVRALSIEMIYLFLREMEDKLETDVFLYIFLDV